MHTNTIILGAGLTGLGAARELPGSVVYEAKDHPGGHVYSHHQGGLHFDEGAHICHAKDPEWVELLKKKLLADPQITQTESGSAHLFALADRLAAARPDDLSPRAALELLYELKALTRDS